MVFITLHYSTPFGQAICIEVEGMQRYHKLDYVDNNTWAGEVNFQGTGLIKYRYLVVREEDFTTIYRTEGGKEKYPHSIDLSHISSFAHVTITDVFHSGFDAEDTFLATSYFRDVIYGKRAEESVEIKKVGSVTGLLKLRATSGYNSSILSTLETAIA